METSKLTCKSCPISANGNRPSDSLIRLEKKGFKRAEAATYLGVAKITIDRLTKRGLLHPSRALRHPIYSKDDLDRFLSDTSASSVHGELVG